MCRGVSEGLLGDKSIAILVIRALCGSVSASERMEMPKDAIDMLMVSKIKIFDYYISAS